MNLSSIPVEIYKEILCLLPGKSLLNISKINKYTQKICSDDNLWKHYINLNFNIEDYTKYQKWLTNWNDYRTTKITKDFKIYTFKQLVYFLIYKIKYIKYTNYKGIISSISIEDDLHPATFKGKFICKDKNNEYFTYEAWLYNMLPVCNAKYINSNQSLKFRRTPKYFGDYIQELDITLFEAVEEYMS
jgi:hypothetical protein